MQNKKKGKSLKGQQPKKTLPVQTLIFPESTNH